jgi:uncharacterized membrane protein
LPIDRLVYYKAAMGMIISMAVHVLAAVIWVGGMFFAHMILRPALRSTEPSVRLPVWSRVLARFFLWVWLSIVAIVASGLTMVSLEFGGFSTVSPYVGLMMTMGGVMVLIYLGLYFIPWRRFQTAVAKSDWPAADAQMKTMRRLVGVNLVLGLLTLIVAAGGRFY